MQRILQPGEIESLDHTNQQRIRLPQPVQLFAERAARLEQKADGNPIGDYLRFVEQLVKAQRKAAETVQTAAPDAAQMKLAQEHSMPLFPAASHVDPVWRDVLDQLLDSLDADASIPEALKPTLQSLRKMGTEDRDALGRRVLMGLLTENGDLAAAPIVMAALQVMFTDRAHQLKESDIPYTDPATVCPVCGTEPVASVLRIGGRDAGLRYLHCGCCATEWHMVRIKCTHCESTKGVRYQQVEDSGDVVVAETCDVCHTYRKLANQEKDPLAEPLADDLATLMLDLLMSETEFARASMNPLLPMSESDATPDAS